MWQNKTDIVTHCSQHTASLIEKCANCRNKKQNLAKQKLVCFAALQIQKRPLDKSKSWVILTSNSQLKASSTYQFRRTQVCPEPILYCLKTSQSHCWNNNWTKTISTFNWFPESCWVTFKLFSGFAQRQNTHRTQTDLELLHCLLSPSVYSLLILTY